MSKQKLLNFLEKEDMIKHDKTTGEPLVLTLKNYIESEKCIKFDYSEDKLELSFNIFTDSLDENHESGDNENCEIKKQESQNHSIDQIEEGLNRPGGRRPVLKRFITTVEGKKTCQTYWFLKLLAKEKALAQLCHHPYITAFLELHYSTVQKARTQMQDSVPHLALVLLLLVLVSTLQGDLNKNYENVLWIATFPCALVLVLDTISFIGLKTQWINKKMGNSLFKDFKKPNTTYFGRFTCIFINLTHVLGYFISIASLICGYLVCEQRKLEGNDGTNTPLLKQTLEIVLLCYPMLLMGVEITQMMSAGIREYFRSTKNRIDLIEIVFAFVIGSMSMAIGIDDSPWMPNLIWIVILLSFTQLFHDIVDCLPNNDKFHVQQYLHMFTQVVKRYFVIMMGFCPFLMAFAACFKDISSNKNPFARNLYGAFVKAIFWFIGEVEDKEWINNEEDGDEKINTALKTEDVLGKFILLMFIFLFVIVLMNLLNAIAIGDIQQLREDAIKIRNKKKIEEILEQYPIIPSKLHFNIDNDPKLQSDNWFLQLFLDKGYFGEAVYDAGQDESNHTGFLPEATFFALKGCTQKRYDWRKYNPEPLFDKLRTMCTCTTSHNKDTKQYSYQ